MKYVAVMQILSDVRKVLKCIKCNGSLFLVELGVKNFMKAKEKVYLHLVCSKCDYKHYFEQLSPGVWGLIKLSGLEGNE